MAPETRFAEHNPADGYPILTLARMLDLTGSTVYIVNEDGIHEGIFLQHEDEDILVRDSQSEEELKAHASKAHLFLRDARHHYRTLAHDTNWGARAGDDDDDDDDDG